MLWVLAEKCLILLTFLLTLTLDRVDTDLFVILLKGSQILSGLGELSLFHTLSDVPVDEGTLGVHQIEFVVKTGPGLGNGGGVAQHAHGTLHLGEVTAGNDSGWLVVDSDLEEEREGIVVIFVLGERVVIYLSVITEREIKQYYDTLGTSTENI